MTQRTILVVDDEEFIRLTLKKIFTEENYRVILHENGTDALKCIENEEVDLAFLDINLPDLNGIEVLKRMKAVKPDLLVIVATGYASVESAIKALKLGAYDYIKKPFKADAIKLIARLALETLTLKQTVKRLKDERKHGHDAIVGSSDAINKVKHQITEFARYDSETVLIIGESGSGKELVAEALHSSSSRSENEFVVINCASIPENLLESELFGYEKGAFTDARSSKEGLFEKADGGTLFLDEIGEMSIGLQASLLRVIEQKRFRRLGSTDDIVVNTRIVAATNKNLKQAIVDKQFRQDLYYRLNVLRIDLPPLRDRDGDIIELAEYFLRQFNRVFNKEISSFSEEARHILTQYHWPGNVRELKNTIERVCILQKGETVQAHDLPTELLNEQLQDSFFADEADINSLTGSLDDILRQTEIKLLKQAYLMSGRNTSKASRLLKIPRETLRYKFTKYKIGEEDEV